MEVKDLILKKKINGFAEYADKHDIFNIFHNMVQKLLTKQPMDPIEYMIEHLQQPQGSFLSFFLFICLFILI